MESLLKVIPTLLDVPYKFWNPNVSCAGDHGPFWAHNGPLPSHKAIEEGQMNCAGFLNLLCRSQGISIPGADEKDYYAGGTRVWHDYLQQKGVLHPFRPWLLYPKGTLLLRNYRSEEDQGHLALYMGPNSIVHSWPETGSCFATIQPYYYEFVCLPEDWMS